MEPLRTTHSGMPIVNTVYEPLLARTSTDHIAIDNPHANDETIPTRQPEPRELGSDIVRREIIEENTGLGAAAGFATGCAVSIIGLPVLAIMVASSKGKISKKAAKFWTDILVPLTLPGMIVAAIGSGIGAGIGNIVGRVKARRNKNI